MCDVELGTLLGELDDEVKAELSSTPEVVAKGDSLNVEGLPITARRWT